MENRVTMNCWLKKQTTSAAMQNNFCIQNQTRFRRQPRCDGLLLRLRTNGDRGVTSMKLSKNTKTWPEGLINYQINDFSEQSAFNAMCFVRTKLLLHIEIPHWRSRSFSPWSRSSAVWVGRISQSLRSPDWIFAQTKLLTFTVLWRRHSDRSVDFDYRGSRSSCWCCFHVVIAVVGRHHDNAACRRRVAADVRTPTDAVQRASVSRISQPVPQQSLSAGPQRFRMRLPDALYRQTMRNTWVRVVCFSPPGHAVGRAPVTRQRVASCSRDHPRVVFAVPFASADSFLR